MWKTNISSGSTGKDVDDGRGATNSLATCRNASMHNKIAQKQQQQLTLPILISHMLQRQLHSDTHIYICSMCASVLAFLILVACVQLCCIMFISHFCLCFIANAHMWCALNCCNRKICCLLCALQRFFTSLAPSNAWPPLTRVHWQQNVALLLFLFLCTTCKLPCWLLVLCCVYFCCNLIFLVLLQIDVFLFFRCFHLSCAISLRWRSKYC